MAARANELRGSRRSRMRGAGGSVPSRARGHALGIREQRASHSVRLLAAPTTSGCFSPESVRSIAKADR